MHRGCAGANQVANGFVLLIGHVDGRELASAVKTGKLIGIPPIGLHAIRSFFGNERRTDQIAVNGFAAQMAAQDEAARPGFINQAQFDVRLREPLEEFVNGIERPADNAVAAHFAGVLGRNGHSNGILVDVQTDIMHDFIHGCLVSLHGY